MPIMKACWRDGKENVINNTNSTFDKEVLFMCYCAIYSEVLLMFKTN